MTLPRRYPRNVLSSTIAAAIVIAALLTNVHELAATFVVAYTAVVSVALGVLAIGLIAQLTTATWFEVFRPRADLVIACLPALALIGILLLLALPTTYPWVGHDTPMHAYLNVPFFIVRFVVYWAVWIGTAESFRRARQRRTQVAAAGLIALGITMTFASFDWMMSATPDWQSSIYGVYWFAGGVLGGLAALAVLASLSGDRWGWPAPSSEDIHSLAKLMLTFVLFWLYIGFSQYVVIWSANIPREVSWYVPRTHGGWGLIAGVLLFGNFVFPFLLLLLEPVMRARRLIAGIGIVLLALRYLDMFWVIMPGLVPIRLWTVVAGIAVLALLMSGARRLRLPRRLVTRAQSLRAGSRPEPAR